MMDHPNIAKVYDAGQIGEPSRVSDRFPSGDETRGLIPHDSPGRPYFVMELVKGVPITKYCDDHNLTPKERLELFIPVCHAVQHAHQKGIIHRDLKPSNVMVARYDDKPIPKVIDFGIAKATGQKLTDRTLFTQFGQLVGTLEYMSPEQATLNALDIDTRSDIYSLGVLLYELLTGSTPLEKKRLKEGAFDEILGVIREEETPSPSTRLLGTAELPNIAAQRKSQPAKLAQLMRGDLDWIAMKALDKDRTRRYETASAFAEDIQRHLADEAVLARRPTTAYRLRKLARRHRGALMFIALSVLLTLGGVGGVFWQWQKTELALSDAVIAREDANKKAKAEREARQSRETMLTDMYTSFGVAAGTRGEPRQAVLWFANAARFAGDDRQRADANRTRAAAWGRKAFQPVRALFHPTEWIESMTFHAGGRKLLTHSFDAASEETTCQLWDLERETALPFPGDASVVSAAAWDAAGERLAIGTPQGNVIIHRFPGGEPLQRVGLRGRIARVLFSPDGRYCALAAGIWVRVWDCETASFATPESEHPASVTTMAFHPQGELLATACKDHSCRVFAVPGDKGEPLFPPARHYQRSLQVGSQLPIPPTFLDNGRSVLIVSKRRAELRDSRTGQLRSDIVVDMPDLPRDIYGVAVSADGKHVVLAGTPQASIFNVASGQQVGPHLKHLADEYFLSASFSPDGTALLTASEGRTARLWSVPGGMPLDSPLMHSTSLSCVAFAADGRHLATAQRGRLIRLWALATDSPRDYRVSVGSNSLSRLSLDGRFLLPTGLNQGMGNLRSTQVFDVTTGQRVGPQLKADGIIMDGAFSPDGLQVAIAVSRAATWQERSAQQGQQPGQLQFWDWRAGKLQNEIVQLSSEPRKLDYSPDGRQLASIGANGDLTVVDPATAKTLRQWPAHPPYFPNNHHSSNGAVRFSPDSGNLLTFGTPTTSIRVWDPLTGQFRRELKQNKKCADVQFSPDGRLVATAGYVDNRVCVWELTTGALLASLTHPDATYTALFSPDGKYLLTACQDGMARLWDWRAGRMVCPPFEHEHQLHAVSFNRDGRHVLSASDDGVLKIWEWQTARMVCPPFSLGGAGLSLAVTPDGSRIVCGGRMDVSPVFHLDDWLAPSALATDELCLWGEIVSGQRVEDGGGVTNLTAEEWLKRWQTFRHRPSLEKSHVADQRP
jgi:WD40 repeat protein